MSHSQSVGGTYLFQDKYINHVSKNGLTTLSKCKLTSFALDVYFSAFLTQRVTHASYNHCTVLKLMNRTSKYGGSCGALHSKET